MRKDALTKVHPAGRYLGRCLAGVCTVHGDALGLEGGEERAATQDRADVLEVGGGPYSRHIFCRLFRLLGSVAYCRSGVSEMHVVHVS